MSQSIAQIIDDIASGRIKVDSDVKYILPSLPLPYMFQDNETVLVRHG
jgi:hypothetical protein